MPKSMDKIVALCKRRGFVFQNSEIYGGQNGFWDYGPLGTLLKRNLRDAWWTDMVACHDELSTPPGGPRPYGMVGVETSIIMNPQVWKCSGHYDLFHDFMIDCRKTKKRYRLDHVRGRWVEGNRNLGTTYQPKKSRVFVTAVGDAEELEAGILATALRYFGIKKKDADKLTWSELTLSLTDFLKSQPVATTTSTIPMASQPIGKGASQNTTFASVVGPDAEEAGTLTEPREFNLMFKTTLGALGGEEDAAFLRPETAQGMFVNFKNVLDSSRVKLPFGIAQVGKSFRNEITPRNFTFRSREFEQMEIEFFCRPDESRDWYAYWRDRRYQWYLGLGISPDNLRLRDHHAEELAHYSVGTADIEYKFPFLAEGEYGELEGVAHRGDFDLRSHTEGKLAKENGELTLEMDADGKPKYRGSGKDLSYFDDATRERFIPHVIEPSAGADRATLAFLCEAYDEDTAPDEKGAAQERVVLRLHPRLAPVKAAVFPLIKKEGMPEKAAELYRQFKQAGVEVMYDVAGAIGRRYRRQDEIGTPFCLTIDGDTMADGTVTVRDRDTLSQQRLSAADAVAYVKERTA